MRAGGMPKLPDMDIWDLKRHFELAVGVAAPGKRGATGSGLALVGRLRKAGREQVGTATAARCRCTALGGAVVRTGKSALPSGFAAAGALRAVADTAAVVRDLSLVYGRPSRRPRWQRCWGAS